MKRYQLAYTQWITVGFLFCSSITMAQVGIYRYHSITGLSDTLKRKSTPCELIFSTTESIDRSGQTQKLNAADTTRMVSFLKEHNQKVVYKNSTTGEMISREFAIVEHIVVKDSLVPINWKLEKGSRNIGGFTCKKAEADVRGRHYTAWYAPEIPISTGPWKFYGLPGLILEVSDTGRHVLFVFESLLLPAPVGMLPGPFQRVRGQKEMTYTEFVKARASNLTKFSQMNTQPGDSGGPVTINIQSVEIFPKSTH